MKKYSTLISPLDVFKKTNFWTAIFFGEKVDKLICLGDYFENKFYTNGFKDELKKKLLEMVVLCNDMLVLLRDLPGEEYHLLLEQDLVQLENLSVEIHNQTPLTGNHYTWETRQSIEILQIILGQVTSIMKKMVAEARETISN